MTDVTETTQVWMIEVRDPSVNGHRLYEVDPFLDAWEDSNDATDRCFTINTVAHNEGRNRHARPVVVRLHKRIER